MVEEFLKELENLCNKYNLKLGDLGEELSVTIGEDCYYVERDRSNKFKIIGHVVVNPE